MEKNKGQALVEFVIILPIFILLVFTSIDFGRIIYTKISLENTLNDAVMMYKEGKSVTKIERLVKRNDKNTNITISTDSNYSVFNINRKIDIVTPGLNIALDDPYTVEVNRSTYNVR